MYGKVRTVFSAPKRALWLCAGLLLSACATTTAPQGIPMSPNARLYAYLMAHGMARGAVMSRQIGPQDIGAVAAADHSAQQAVLVSLQHHSSDNDQRADHAIAELLGTISPQK